MRTALLHTDRASQLETVARKDTPYLNAVPVEMHGHRKKVLFFIECLHDYARNLGKRPGEIRVLEPGCGNGRNVTLPSAEQGFSVTGVDLHEPSIASARGCNKLATARFLSGDFRTLSSDEFFHVVILSDILEHIEDPRHMVEVALSHLTTHGMILISIPNGYGPFEIERFLIRIGLLKPILAMIHFLGGIKRRIFGQRISAGPVYNEESGHVQFFTLRRFRLLLSECGLQIARQKNGCLFGADLTSYLFRFFPALAPLSLAFADRLPASAVSTWYFQCFRKQR